MCETASVDLRERELENDGFWWVIIVLFILWAYSQYTLNEAINRCYAQDGEPNVTSYFFGTTWKIKCVKQVPSN